MNRNPAWDGFVLAHTHPLNVALHGASALLLFGGPIAALITGQPAWWLAFFASGLLGGLGHRLSGDAAEQVGLRDLTSRPTVVLFVVRMLALVAAGRWGAEIGRARAGQGGGVSEA